MDKIIDIAFTPKILVPVLERSVEKGISLDIVNKISALNYRKELYMSIYEGRFKIKPQQMKVVPKDGNGTRIVMVGTDLERVLFASFNNTLFELCPNLVSSYCRSYKKGESTQKTVRTLSNYLIRKSQSDIIGYKLDVSKYFDSVPIEIIDSMFDQIEIALYGKKVGDCVLNLLREFYHDDRVYDLDGNLINKYCGLRQGCAVSSFLSNMCLYEIDEGVKNMGCFYQRYSDDIVVLGDNCEEALSFIKAKLSEYSLNLNPKKVTPLYADEWFCFLGFSLKGSRVTIGPRGLRRFQEEIDKRSIKGKHTAKQAFRQIITYLYCGERNWASAYLSIINCEDDINEMNKYIMDAISACATQKKRIGGLGYDTHKNTGVISRGKGKNVKANRAKQFDFSIYNSMQGMQKALHFGHEVFSACANEMLLANKSN